MAVFLVTPLSDNFDVLHQALKERALDFYVVQNKAGFLVSETGTSEEVSHKIGISEPDGSSGALGSALVTRVSSYFGRGSTGMWEWIQSRMERS